MLERVIYRVLEAGINAISADLSLLDDIFQPEGSELRVDDDELVQIKAYFSGKPPKVVHGYAIPGIQVPCYTIVTAEESVESQALDHFVTFDEEDPTEEVLGVIEQRVYQIYTLAENPDACFWLYKILKAILLSNIRLLISYGGMVPLWSGQELQPLLELRGDPTFVRLLRLTVKAEEYVNLSLSYERIRDIDIRRDDVGGGIVPYETDTI